SVGSYNLKIENAGSTDFDGFVSGPHEQPFQSVQRKTVRTVRRIQVPIGLSQYNHIKTGTNQRGNEDQASFANSPSRMLKQFRRIISTIERFKQNCCIHS